MASKTNTKPMNGSKKYEDRLFSKALFKQSCKANGTMWTIITAAVCFMLACVMLISGSGSLGEVKNSIQDTIIREEVDSQLEQRGFAVLDSRSNFLFASTDRKDGGTLYKELKKNGILVRHFDASRIQNWLRITIGTSEQMKIFVNTLDKIMEE